MKSFASLMMSLVLTAAMLTGCGCTNRNAGMTPPTTLLPTTEETTMPTAAPTQTTAPADTGETDETVNHGNGPLVEESTAVPSGTAAETPGNSARQAMPIK